LWPHTVAIDALAVGRQLHEAADDLLVPLLLPSAPHRAPQKSKKSPQSKPKDSPEKTGRNFNGPGQKSASPSSTEAGIRALVGDSRGRRLGFCGGGEEEEEANGNGGDGEPRRERWEKERRNEKIGFGN